MVLWLCQASQSMAEAKKNGVAAYRRVCAGAEMLVGFVDGIVTIVDFGSAVGVDFV